MENLGRLVGDNARKARAALGLTQSQVAERVGLATEVYGRIERGVTLPSLTTLVRLARALQVEPGALLAVAKTNPKADLPVGTLRRLTSLLEGLDDVMLARVLLVVKAVVPVRKRRQAAR